MSGSFRVLSVGNSFSTDTMEYLAAIAKACGKRDVVIGNLYVGGCSIRKHFAHLEENAAVYEYYVDRGEGFSCTPQTRIADAVQAEDWDVISIQHGSADGSLYGDPSYYEKLPLLVQGLKALAPRAKIAFNMTWTGEPYLTWSEIARYKGDQQALYRDITAVTRDTVQTTAGIDVISPTGTAVQNARTALAFELTRDGYHLSFDVGRYLAGLTFFKALSGCAIDAIAWAPEGVSEEVRHTLIRAANAAVQTPFEVTSL